jgi:hypothetical protein
MSRNYANFATAIWRPEDDFGDLTMPAQWAYFMLSTQSDISAAGVLSLNVRRWSMRARGVTREIVVAALKELQAAEKVFYDYDTEELLIRTFVKADGGYGNRKRRPVIERAALELESPRLREALAKELRKLGDEVMEKLADRLSAPYGIAYPSEEPQNVPGTSSTSAEGVATEPDKVESSQVDRLSDGLSRFDGVVVTQGLGQVPQPSTHIPQPVPPPADASHGDDQLELAEMPEKPPPPAEQRAWGLAREWSDNRIAKGTPIPARGKADPIMVLQKLILPVAKTYTDEEIRKALADLDQPIPTANRLDAAVAEVRRVANGEPPKSRGRFPVNTGQNKHNDSQDRRPIITGVIASQAVAEERAGGAR